MQAYIKSIAFILVSLASFSLITAYAISQYRGGKLIAEEWLSIKKQGTLSCRVPAPSNRISSNVPNTLNNDGHSKKNEGNGCSHQLQSFPLLPENSNKRKKFCSC